MRTPDERAVAAEPASAEPKARTGGLGTITRNLTLVNVSFTIAALVTSPLQARALGPAGRGDLAAIAVVSGLFGLLGDLGLAAFTVRESARGTPVRRLVGSIAPMLLALGLVYAAAGPLLARVIGGDRDTVRVLLLVVFVLMPLLTPSTLTTAMVWGQQRWGLFAVQRLTIPVGSLIVYSVLYLAHALTVESAGIALIVLSVIAVLPGYLVLRGAGRPQWSRSLAADARSYGRRVWLSQLANQTNARLDQLLMTRLVASSELGLYVIAVNISMLQNAFTAAISSAMLPRAAAGDPDVAARALRVMIVGTMLLSAALIVSVPIVIPVVFGQSFSGAVLMSQILLVAAIPFGIVQLMTATLNGAGEPGVAARGEVMSVAITVPSLVVFVGRYGGEAAALTSVASYSVTALYLMSRVRGLLRMGWREMLILRRSDLQALRALPIVGRILK